jgi:anti-sigma factor RsiW
MCGVSDVASRLSAEEMADLCAFADGTLPADRRAEVEARVAASPGLLELVERQRQAVTATRALSAEPPPASLVERAETLRSRHRARRSRARRLMPRVALAGGLAVVAVVAAVVLSGGPGGPTVADAARLASEPPTGPAPRPVGNGSTRLAVDVEGVAFPNLARWAGWQTLGVRRGHVDGRDATVVVYRKDGKQIAYVIVAGPGLARPSGERATARRGVEYQTLRVDGRLAVTWRRGGHTCVLIGDATRSELLELARWPVTR